MPIHFLWGDEDFLIEKALIKIKNEVLKGDINELNYRSVDSPSFAEFSELIRTNAMMFGDVLISIKCPNYFLTDKKSIKLDDKQTQELITGINNVNERVHLVLICPTPKGEKKKPDSRKKLFKELSKVAEIQEFQSYKNYEEYKLIPIIKKMASEIGINIKDTECSNLIQTTGSSLRDLFNQLEKLKLYAYPKTDITQEMIDNIATPITDVFKIVDYILQKDYLSALNLISDIHQKEHYLPTLALIQTMINNLLKTKIYSKKMSMFDLALKLGYKNDFLVKKNLEKTANVSIRELARLKINLSEIDFMLKNGSLKDPLCAYELAFTSERLENIC